MKTEIHPIQKALDLIDQAKSLYQQASESECTCYSDPDRNCPHCSRWERADSRLESATEILAIILKRERLGT
jgi:hypothetical protein